MNGTELLRMRRRHPSQYIAMGLLAFTGTMMFTSQSIAGGAGSSSSSPFEDIDNSQAVLVGLGILLGVYALIITEVVHRTLAAAVGGLLAIIALSFYSEKSFTLGEVTTLIDWETIGLLLGMMVMVGILSHTGLFEWFAVQAYKRSGGSVWTLVVILCSVTAVL